MVRVPVRAPVAPGRVLPVPVVPLVVAPAAAPAVAVAWVVPVAVLVVVPVAVLVVVPVVAPVVAPAVPVAAHEAVARLGARVAGVVVAKSSSRWRPRPTRRPTLQFPTG